MSGKQLRKLDQSGAVSLISVVIFSIIITIVSTAYIRSVISQQKNALNYDLSNRAYYAAESGVQDTIRAINANPALLTNKDSCSPFTGQGSFNSTQDYGLSFTCQLIKTDATTLEGEVSQNSAMMLKIEPKPLPPAGNRNYNLSLFWSPQKNSEDTQTENLWPRGTYNKSFPVTANWFQGGTSNKPVHPVLKANLINYPRTNLNRDTLNQNIVFLNPTRDERLGGGQYQDPITLRTTKTNAGSSLVTNAGCYPSSRNDFDAAETAAYARDNEDAIFEGFSCKRSLRLENFNLSSSGQALYLRLNTVFKSTKFQIRLLDDTGASLPLANSQVTIDVTGKSANVYRRVKQTFSIGNGAIRSELPDNALVGGDGICKHYTITTDPAAFNWQCDPTNPGATGY